MCSGNGQHKGGCTCGRTLGRTASAAPDGRGTAVAAPAAPAIAVFGMGCFWDAERRFAKVPGVLATRVGYQGGLQAAPTYAAVKKGGTGHAEVVQVAYDPRQVSYQALLDLFWQGHDPTQGFRQGTDLGSQYRSAIYATTQELLALAQRSRETAVHRRLVPGGRTITTEIAIARPFWPAEEEHQKYFEKNPGVSCGSTPRSSVRAGGAVDVSAQATRSVSGPPSPAPVNVEQQVHSWIVQLQRGTPTAPPPVLFDRLGATPLFQIQDSLLGRTAGVADARLLRQPMRGTPKALTERRSRPGADFGDFGGCTPLQVAQHVVELAIGTKTIVGLKCGLSLHPLNAIKAEVKGVSNVLSNLPFRVVDGKISTKQDCMLPAKKVTKKVKDAYGNFFYASTCQCPNGNEVDKGAFCPEVFPTNALGPFPAGLFCGFPMVNLSGLPGGCACPDGACGGPCKPCKAGYECDAYTDGQGNSTCRERMVKLDLPGVNGSLWPVTRM